MTEMKAQCKEAEQKARDQEICDLGGTVGPQGQPAGPGTRRVGHRLPSDPEHEFVFEDAQREQGAPEQVGPYHPGDPRQLDDPSLHPNTLRYGFCSAEHTPVSRRPFRYTRISSHDTLAAVPFRGNRSCARFGSMPSYGSGL